MEAFNSGLSDRILDPFRYTAERDLELSASLGQLGTYPFNSHTGVKATGPLFDDKKEGSSEHRQEVLKESTRVRILEDLKAWKARKRVKYLVKRRARDYLLTFLDRILAHKQEENMDEWFGFFSNPGNHKLVEIIEEMGVPELRKLAQIGGTGLDDNAMRAELNRIVSVSGKPLETAKSLQIWFHFLDILCERKVPPSRVSWLFRTVNLLNEKKRGEELRIHLFPRASAELLTQWLFFRLTEIGKSTPLTTNSRRAGITTDQPSTLGIKEKIDRWRRGASLLRWMFEDGILRSSIFFEEILKMMRMSFGATDQPSNPSRTSPVTAPVQNSMFLQGFKLPEKIQLLLVTEVMSYAPDAVRMGYGDLFYDCCVAVLKSSSAQQSDRICAILNSCVRLCQNDICVNEFNDSCWRQNRVGLSWELQSLKFSQTSRLTSSIVWEMVKRHGFDNHIVACSVLLEWAVHSSHSDGEENAYIAALGLEEAAKQFSVDLRYVFDNFLAAVDRNEDSLNICSWVLGYLLARGVSLSMDVKPRAKSVSSRQFSQILARTEYATAGIRNMLGLDLHPTQEAESFMQTVLDAKFEVESVVLMKMLNQVAPPSSRIRIVAWLFEHVSNCTINLALIPWMQTSFVFQHLLTELAAPDAGIWSNSSVFGELNCAERLRNSINVRKEKMSDVEGRRLRELFDSQAVIKVPGSASAETPQHQAPSGKSVKTKNNMSITLASFLPGDSKANDRSSSSGVATTSPSLRFEGLGVSGYVGEETRYAAGLKLIHERFDKILGAAKELMIGQDEKVRGDLFTLLVDVTCCRSQDDVGQLSGFCLSTLEASDSPVHLVDSNIIRTEDLFNKWVSRRHFPPLELLSNCLQSSTFVRQIRQSGPYAVRFAQQMTSQLKSDITTSFLRSFGHSWVSRGPSMFEIGGDAAIELSKSIEMFVEFHDEKWDQTLCPWKIANYGWFNCPGKLNKETMAKLVSNACENKDAEYGNNLASVVLAWKAQDVTCIMVKQQFANPIFSEALAALLFCCITRTSIEIRSEYIQMILNHLSAVRDELHEKVLLRLLGACLTAPVPVSMIPSEAALHLLRTINPLIEKQVTFELVKRCTHPFRKTVAGLLDVWKRKWPTEDSFFCKVHRALDADPTENNPILAENLVLCGDGSVQMEDARFADAWAVLEGAKESEANFEFMKGAVVRTIRNQN